QLRVATIAPGDILFIPPHWWHHVESFGLNVMISNWGSPFSLKVWREIGRVRVEALALFHHLTPPEREVYAAVWDEQVFRNAPPPRDELRGTLGAAVATDRLDKNLADAAALFARVPEIWRRHARLAFHYFVFQTHPDRVSSEPGAHEQLIRELENKLARGEV